ncbi:MAG: hypothetical protein KUF82_21290 [Candidatus Thiodiazotropha sp. (ex Ctena orbiculata)]|nr:hypothetical protein [Candidatus Thiodiazotropha taylori]
MGFELRQHPDQEFVRYLCSGLHEGFDTLIPSVSLVNLECKNLLSARNNPSDVQELIEKECQNGFLYGPFSKPPFDKYRVSPLGLAVGKYSGKKRLIVDLSSPHDDPNNSSINELIDKESCRLSYVRIDDAIRAIQSYGRNALLYKVDIANAFKTLPIKSSQWPYFCIKWRNQYFVYVRLVFGCRSSPKIFDTLSQALCWIATNNYGIETIFHLLDDFLTVDGPDYCNGKRTMALLSLLFGRLHIPLAHHKCVGPTVCLEYLGIILDSSKMEARLPRDKVQRILQFTENILGKTCCTKLELLQLLGHFNFASRVVLPGRSFVSYLIHLSTTVKGLHEFVLLDRHCREDLFMWYRFLQKWNGVSLFYETVCTSSFHMELFTDASLIGFGGIFNTKWFCSVWPDNIPSVKDENLSMAFRELYPIVAAAVLWGKLWTTKRIVFVCDNMSAVYILQKGRSKCLPIMKLIRTLTWTAAVNNFHFTARHLCGEQNKTADSLSRLLLQRFRDLAPEADKEPQICPQPQQLIWD